MKTPIAAEVLSVSEANLHYLIRARKIAAPSKDTSGDYVWSDSNIEAARQALSVDRRRREVARVG